MDGNVSPGQPSAEAEAIEGAVDTGSGGFELDAVLETEIAEEERPSAPLGPDELERVIARPDLLPAGSIAEPLGPREYAFREHGMRAEIRVSTESGYAEEPPESLELWR